MNNTTKLLLICSLFLCNMHNLTAGTQQDEIINTIKQRVENRKEAESKTRQKSMNAYNKHVSQCAIEIDYTKWCKHYSSEEKQLNLNARMKDVEELGFKAFEKHIVPFIAKDAAIRSEITFLLTALSFIERKGLSLSETIALHKGNDYSNLDLFHYSQINNMELLQGLLKGEIKAKKFLKKLSKQYPNTTDENQ